MKRGRDDKRMRVRVKVRREEEGRKDEKRLIRKNGKKGKKRKRDEEREMMDGKRKRTTLETINVKCEASETINVVTNSHIEIGKGKNHDRHQYHRVHSN